MPQMMPLNWVILMFFFILIFYLFNNMNYFIFLNKIKKMKSNKLLIKNNWKW
uniref:ATP synthase complex subunit 8 n=1 Tax=Chaetocnema paganettii TaxID=1425541 RepID=A0A3G1GS33_9CUCU|nr:ATP synthase F0 subunit 8 [Chaetocnema paganettii]